MSKSLQNELLERRYWVSLKSEKTTTERRRNSPENEWGKPRAFGAYTMMLMDSNL